MNLLLYMTGKSPVDFPGYSINLPVSALTGQQISMSSMYIFKAALHSFLFYMVALHLGELALINYM